MVIIFISGYHETALKNKEATECPEELLERTETFSAALLTNHLLTKLMPGDNYVISSDYSDKPLLCPCHDNCGMLMKYGSTGLGLSYIQSFYGKCQKGGNKQPWVKRIFAVVIISSHEPKAQVSFSDQNMFTAHRCWGHCCCKLSTFLYSFSIGLISIKHGTKHTV